MLRQLLPAICVALSVTGIRLAVEGVATSHEVDLYEALAEVERLKPYPVERFAKRAATIRIEIRPVR